MPNIGYINGYHAESGQNWTVTDDAIWLSVTVPTYLETFEGSNEKITACIPLEALRIALDLSKG